VIAVYVMFVAGVPNCVSQSPGPPPPFNQTKLELGTRRSMKGWWYARFGGYGVARVDRFKAFICACPGLLTFVHVSVLFDSISMVNSR